MKVEQYLQRMEQEGYQHESLILSGDIDEMRATIMDHLRPLLSALKASGIDYTIAVQVIDGGHVGIVVSPK